jgi:uncharacterized membrane protein
MAFCSECGTQVADGVQFCTSCGKPMGAPAAAAASADPAPVAGLADNVAGLLAYITIIPAIIFLVIEPFNRNRFVRFHAFQCLFTAAACFVLGIALSIIGFIPGVNLLLLFLAPIVWIGVFILIILCMVRAYQGQKFKLPIIGDMAEKQANAV